MTNILDQRGIFWWLCSPDIADDRQISGHLIVRDDGHISFELDQALDLTKLQSGPLFEQINSSLSGRRVAGRLAGSKDYVYIDGLQLETFDLVGETIPAQRFIARTCLIGSEPSNSGAEFDFSQFRIDITPLDEWAGFRSISVKTIDCDERHKEITVNLGRTNLEYNVDGGIISVENATFYPGTFESLPQPELKLKQKTWLKFHATRASPFIQIVQSFRLTEEFFAVLLGSYYRFDWPYFIQRNGTDENWYRAYFYRGNVPDFVPGPWNTSTNFSWVRDKLGELYTGWRNCREEYGPGCYLYLAAMRKSDLYVEHRFVNLIWALESFDRRTRVDQELTLAQTGIKNRIDRILGKFASSEDAEDRRDGRWLRGQIKRAHEPNLESRILDFLRRIPIEFEVRSLKRFARRCADRRNEISHLGGPKGAETYSLFHGDVFKLATALEYLYHAVLLSEIGFDPGIVKEALTQTPLAQMKILPAIVAAEIAIKGID